ncbi:MAG: NAD(P)-dependent alcohol dehydrogenase [Acidimicrobiales bacterium]
MAFNRRVKLVGTGKLVVESEDMPVPGTNEYLVKISSVGVCGSDVHYFEHGRIGNFIVESPLVLGHEAAGVIMEAGPGADQDRVGHRVAIEPGVPCGRCKQCRLGRYNLCPEVRFLATPPIDGAFSDYITHNGDFLYDVPDDLSDDQAALCEPLSVGIWANRRAGVSPADRVLVTGCGPIGLMVAQVSRECGARVVLSDIVPSRLDAARSLGFTDLHDPAFTPVDESGITADVFMECTGVADVAFHGIKALAPAGRAVLVGMAPTEEQVLPVAAMQAREIVLTGVFRYANTYPLAIELFQRDRIQIGPIVGTRFGLEDVAAALRASREDPSCIKPMVVTSL